jgi:hypothetical protein
MHVTFSFTPFQIIIFSFYIFKSHLIPFILLKKNVLLFLILHTILNDHFLILYFQKSPNIYFQKSPDTFILRKKRFKPLYLEKNVLFFLKSKNIKITKCLVIFFICNLLQLPKTIHLFYPKVCARVYLNSAWKLEFIRRPILLKT